MDVREELAKLGLGKIVGGIIGGLALLVSFLVLIVWREALSQKWAQVAGELSKPALMALLGLALIGLVLAVGLIALLGYLLYQARQTARAASVPTVTKPRYYRFFGLFWDKDFAPYCPVDETLLFVHYHYEVSAGGLWQDVMQCPKCAARFPLRDDDGDVATLPDLRRYIRNQLDSA